MWQKSRESVNRILVARIKLSLVESVRVEFHNESLVWVTESVESVRKGLRRGMIFIVQRQMDVCVCHLAAVLCTDAMDGKVAGVGARFGDEESFIFRSLVSYEACSTTIISRVAVSLGSEKAWVPLRCVGFLSVLIRVAAWQ